LPGTATVPTVFLPETGFGCVNGTYGIFAGCFEMNSVLGPAEGSGLPPGAQALLFAFNTPGLPPLGIGPAVAGDVIMLDPSGTVSDVIRFNPSGNIEFFSNDASITGAGLLPTVYYPNNVTIVENQAGNTFYTPTATGGPGF
jgi:hypothetical protein